MDKLIVNSQLPINKSGINGKVVHIDTNGEFTPSRIVQISESRKIDHQLVLKNILVTKPFYKDQLIEIFQELKELIPKKQIKMVTIDSLTLPFIGMSYGEKDTKILFIKMYKKLIDLLNRFPFLLIVYTSIVIPKRYFPKCMTRTTITRIRLQHIGGQHKRARLIQHKRNMKDGDFYITKAGISNQGIDFYNDQDITLIK